MKYSKKITDEMFPDKCSVVVITNNFHIYRSVFLARLNGYENVSHLHCGLQWYNIIPNYVRETLAIIKMWILNK